MGDSSDDALSIWLEQAPARGADRRRGTSARRGAWPPHLVFAQSVHSAHPSLPGCLPLLHLRRAAARGTSAYLSPDEVLAIARAGAAAGCTEALFTLGDKPELRYRAAREALDALGYETTIDYLQAMCALVLRETGLLPHANPGVMSRSEMAGLRTVSASQGIMLESLSARLMRTGRSSLWLARQAARGASRDAAARGRAARPIHDRHSDRHRRDAGRAPRGAIRHPRSAPPFRACSGSHRSELPRQAGHQARRRCGARSRRPALEHRRRAPDPGPRDEYPGASQPVAGRLSAADCGGDQ